MVDDDDGDDDDQRSAGGRPLDLVARHAVAATVVCGARVIGKCLLDVKIAPERVFGLVRWNFASLLSACSRLVTPTNCRAAIQRETDDGVVIRVVETCNCVTNGLELIVAY